jgi:hypothetical protein
LSFEAKLARWEEHQQKLLQLFEAGRGNQLPGVSGTAWAVYNAVTQWTDHAYPVLQSARFLRRGPSQCCSAAMRISKSVRSPKLSRSPGEGSNGHGARESQEAAT